MHGEVVLAESQSQVVNFKQKHQHLELSPETDSQNCNKKLHIISAREQEKLHKLKIPSCLQGNFT